MVRTIRRRDFLTDSLLGTTLAAVCHTGFAQEKNSTSPNEKLNLATVGTTNRAGANIRGCSSQNIVALCDIDDNLLQKAAAEHASAAKYHDFRVMLEREADRIDAVLVSTADHCHAPAAAMALRMGKHVYCEKPLTHTVFEARTLARLAKEKHLVTQMGTQIHAGENYRRVVELVQSGAIGPVREAHVWVPVVYADAKFTTGTPAPDHVNWDLWLGPAPDRPYSEGVHPFNWRRFWDYGTGGLGDFGCHYMDLVHWALKLKHPTTIEAQGPPVDAVSTPAWCTVRYEYPAREDMPAMTLNWYDGGRRPEILGTLKGGDGKPLDWTSGQLFVGDNGMILSNYSNHILLPAEKFTSFARPERWIAKSIGHHEEWLHAIRDGSSTTCNFDYSGALTEAVLLGTVAYRSGSRLEWDAENMKVTNAPEAQALIHKEYRKGWTL